MMITVQDRLRSFRARNLEYFLLSCPQLFPEWAAEVGMDRATFEETVADPHTREALVAAKKEGIRNKVDATPAVFIDGRRYVYELQQDVVVGVLLEAYDAAAGPQRKL